MPRRRLPFLTAVLCGAALCAQTPTDKLRFDSTGSVTQRRILPPEPQERIDWEARVTALLKEEPGDIVITAVGDMIFNEQLSTRTEPCFRQLFRIFREADVAYGNLEFSMNRHPEAKRTFYDFRTDPEFAWEVAALGINLVGMANNHALDFGPKGLTDCLDALDGAGIHHAGAGATLEEAREPATVKIQGQQARVGLLSYLRFWTPRFRSRDASAPSLATIDPAVVLVADGKGGVQSVEALQEGDVQAMEEDLLLARRHHDHVLVALHNHDVSHHRAFGIQDRTPDNDAVMFHRAVDAGAAAVLGSGPHVLRGVEVYKGKPIFYSLSNFIYQYRTPGRIPVDLVHQRDGEMPRPANTPAADRRDLPEIFECVVARMTFRKDVLKRVELIPVSLDREGPLYGAPRLPGTQRGREILDRLRRLSEPYGTRFVDRGWYLELALPR